MIVKQRVKALRSVVIHAWGSSDPPNWLYTGLLWDLGEADGCLADMVGVWLWGWEGGKWAGTGELLQRKRREA